MEVVNVSDSQISNNLSSLVNNNQHLKQIIDTKGDRCNSYLKNSYFIKVEIKYTRIIRMKAILVINRNSKYCITYYSPNSQLPGYKRPTTIYTYI